MNSARRLPSCASGALLAFLLPAALLAQQPPAGLQAQTRSLASGANAVLTTPNGVVSCTGTQLVLTAPGQPPRTLLQLPGFVFGSFTIQVDANHVLFGESSTNRLWLVPLTGTPPTAPLATLVFNYDAVLLSPTRALVSAKTTGFSTPDNDLVVVDLGTGGTHTLAKLPGASGPIALAANGDVYYATSSLAFPTPLGTAQLLRFPRPAIDQAIATQATLGIADAQLVLGGLDAAGDLAVDDDGDVFYVDWLQNNVREIDDADGPTPTLGGVLLDYSLASVSPSSLQFLASGGSGGGVFEPFQPMGSSLLVHETDFVSLSQLRTVVPAPATMAATGPQPIPSGPFQLVASAGPANGVGLLAFAAQPAGATVSVQLGGFEQPLLWNAALLTGPVLVPLGFDATGAATLAITNPGFATPLVATTQVAFMSVQGQLGTTQALTITIGL